MRCLHRLLGAILFLTTFLFLLITSFEIAAYSDFGWYEKEYAKYGVCTDLEMEMGDVLEVTREMMAYLRGDREDLVVETVVAGEEREFFNAREKAHMVDVQELFIGGLWLRRIAVVLFVLAIFLLWKLKGDWRRILPKSFLIGTGVMVGLLGGLAILVAQDFHRVFFLFHELFFDNDLWLLDPNTDLLIRMLPEGFFFDMVVRIAIIFAVGLSLLCVASGVLLCRNKNNKYNL
ncbi:MAG: TIGR01906 family membrane protein [Faecalimonas sp.]|nr:TIGR01906 family membrane protein [Faecalimonas sp.]